MRVEDVPEEWGQRAHMAYVHASGHHLDGIRAALAAVAPLIRAAALEEAAGAMDARSDAHAEDARIVLSGRTPRGDILAKYQHQEEEARNGAAAIRALKETT